MRALHAAMLGTLVPLLVSTARTQQRWTTLGVLPRAVQGVVFDAARGRLLAFGSYGESFDAPVRAFEWNGAWQAHQTAGDPGLAVAHQAFFDAARQQVVVTGASSQFLSPQQRTAIYRAGRFTFAPSPVPAGASLVYDAARGEGLAFGGSNTNQTWRWNGTSWSLATPLHAPSPRRGAMLAFDPVRGVVVLFGGGDAANNGLGDTWHWDGQDWTQVASTGPLGRYDGGFAFDTATGTCFLHGGFERTNERLDSWRWDGQAWSLVASGAAPGTGALTATAAGLMLVREGTGRDDGTYLWTGGAFLRIDAPQNPDIRYETNLAYDSARDELVLFGGQPVASGL